MPCEVPRGLVVPNVNVDGAGPFGQATLRVSGDTLAAQSITIGNTYDGADNLATRRAEQSGGTVTTSHLNLGAAATYTLSGGTLTSSAQYYGDTPAVMFYDGSASFLQTGGTHTVVGALALNTGSYTLAGGNAGCGRRKR